MTTSVDAAVAALTTDALSEVVAWVCWPGERDGRGRVVEVHLANASGRVRLDAAGAQVVSGSPRLRTNDLFAEVEATRGGSADDNIPFAWPRLASFFSDSRSPDLAIVHTGRHYFPDRGGHLGEHGSLSIAQSRAPLLLSGSGVRYRGDIAETARLVDIAPTLAWVCGVSPSDLADLDGEIRDDLVTRGAHRVIGVLWDGAEPATLRAMLNGGDLPNVARLLEQGCWLEGGALTEFPSLTLVNHTSMLTGVGPGRHGVVGNVYFDRERTVQVIPNDPMTWPWIGELYRPGVRTLFELIADADPRAVTASVNEMTERGATASTFALVRVGMSQSGGPTDSADFLTKLRAMLPDPSASPFVTASRCTEDDDFALYSAIDLLGLATIDGLWSDEAIAAGTTPLLTWWSSYATDAAHHAGGPGSDFARDSLRDCDARLGVLLERLERGGVLDDTLILLTADHGFESADPSCVGDWTDALHQALDPLPFRDEGSGFIYLGNS